ncbi:hypothetical protein [Stenotrophomonas indicatrix]|uniref:hypothetical protein n=1 Tax=Stenotrophomonas indicatrix TaxID=2045451 RepID=UPI000A6FC880|nr:hypothetical protein [Stenotrophomonas indicatrix]
MKILPESRLARVRPRLCATFAGLLVALLASACTPSPSTASPQGATAPRQDVAPMQSSATPATTATATPPDAGSVLYFIYDVDGDGAVSYEVANGSVATFWFGHAFELAGTRYYTGFAWNTPQKYGKPGEDETGPDSQVTLTEATFTLTGDKPDRPWVFKGAEPWIGTVGAYGTAPDIDSKRKPLEYRTPAGKLVLAVPTSTFATGTSIESYTVLVFNPDYEKSEDGQVWASAGTVITGEDNSAACDEGQVMPCVSNRGVLAFSTVAGSDLPTITVTATGTTISGPGQTRALGAADARQYHYDAARKAYVEK